MKNKFLLLALTALTALSVSAQNPAGNALFFDYEAFQIDDLRRYVNCGNDNSLNTGANITMEVWASVHDPSWNQKIFGKNNGSFNSGYVMAVDQGRLYPEIWTPSQSELLDGFMPPLPNPYYWVHLAVVYDGSNLTGYINGEQVGETSATGSIATNSDNLIIGIAPWDLMNFQYFGYLDEVRIWNTARTEEEINNMMHFELEGDETGLVAYYDFNQSSGTSLPDMSMNSNDGTTTNIVDSDWQASNAVLGDEAMEGQNDVAALWNAIGLTDPRFVVTDNGLSATASDIPDYDYMVFGHDNGSGTSMDDVPSSAPSGFERAGRIWYVNTVGSMTADLIVDLDNAAAGGATIDTDNTASNYVLLHRTGTSGDFSAVATGSSKVGSIITFADYTVVEGYYSVGVGDEFVAIDEVEVNLVNKLYPNPASGQLNILFNSNYGDIGIGIYSIDGKLITSSTNRFNGNGTIQVDISALNPGLYFINAEVEGQLQRMPFVISE